MGHDLKEIFPCWRAPVVHLESYDFSVSRIKAMAFESWPLYQERSLHRKKVSRADGIGPESSVTVGAVKGQLKEMSSITRGCDPVVSGSIQ